MFRPFSIMLVGKKGASAISSWRDVALTFVFLGALLATMAAASTLLGLLAMRMPQPLLELEIRIYRLIAGNASAWLVDFIFRFFNDPGLVYTMVVAACLGHVWVRQRGRTIAALVALGLAFSIGAWTIPYTHWFGYRDRPFIFAPEVIVNAEWRQTWLIYPTFPSGHMRETIGLSVVLIHFWPASRWIVLAFASFIAFSRVYIGAHFAYDVIAGVIIGLLTGSFAVVAVERGSKLVAALANTGVFVRAADLISGDSAADPAGVKNLGYRIVGSLASSALLLAGTFILGLIVFTESPSILASYFHATDETLVSPISGSFDPSFAPVIYALFLDRYYILAVLAALILGRGLAQGRRSLALALTRLVLAAGLGSLLATIFSAAFVRARPFASNNAGLPDVWQGQWTELGAFPDAYLLLITALSVLLAHQWRKLRPLTYLYPTAAAASLIYFGAAWPIASLATLVAGYWVARCSIHISRQVLPPTWRLGDDHSQGAGNDAAGDGYAADWPSVNVGRQS